MSEKDVLNIASEANEAQLSTLAAEINMIYRQARKNFLDAAIEIGRRLVQVKSAVGHGNWGAWLSKNVDYSERQAQNFIRVFKEYGSGQQNLFGDLNPQLVADLSFPQAVALLGIKNPDERAEFIEQNDVASMSSNALKQAIKERDKARKEAEAEKKARNEAELENEKLTQGLENAARERSDLEEKLSRAVEDLESAKQSSGMAGNEVTEEEKAGIADRTEFGVHLENVKRAVNGMMEIAQRQKDSAGRKKYHDAIIATVTQMLKYAETEAE